MKRWLVCLALPVLICLAGCARPVHFAGASADWQINCTINPGGNEKSYAIKYVGAEKELSGVGYAFENSKNFQASDSKGEGKNLRITGSSTLNTPYVDETGFTVRMKWNGREDTIPVLKVQ